MSEEVQDVVDSGVEHDSIDYEAEASKDGWVPKEKFRGPEEKWVDAEEFYKRGQEINPILRSKTERLQKQIDDLTKKLEQTDLSAKEFRKFQQELVKRKEEDFNRQLDELKQQKKDAIAIGDGDAVVSIEEQMDEIKQAKREAINAPQPEAPEVKRDPVFSKFLEDNSWYTKDKKMAALANAIGDELAATEPHLKGRDFLDRVVELVKQEMPHKFKTEERMSPVEGSSTSRSSGKSGGKKSYANLPSDAKAACDDFVSRGWMTQEEYVKAYDWGF